ncbi:MAG: cytochrome c biogenesis protein ResB [Gammaproteobacteria bacterium]|nr:cytochrome c biogenesis protein ResB [Gammaproteobacteria bacterium]
MYPLFQQKLRRTRLRGSSLSFASVLLFSLTVVVSTMWLIQAESGWLLLVSVSLLIAVILLLFRQLPVMWRDLTHYRLITDQSRMQLLHHHVSWRYEKPAEQLSSVCQSVLARQGYRVQSVRKNQKQYLSAIHGRLNRVGLVLSHVAIVIILLGVSLDSDYGLKWQLRFSSLQTESQDIPLNEMASNSRIPARSRLAFEGLAEVQAGQIIDEVRVSTSQGFLTRHLPFPVSVQSVQLDSDHLLLEENFISHIQILDSRRNNPVPTLLGANRAFRYRGYTYFQRGVKDAGSGLSVAMWPLNHANVVPLKFKTEVGSERRLQTRDGDIVVRFMGLNPRNIQAVRDERDARPVHRNIGPSLRYTVTESVSRQREVITYLLPVKQQGRYYFITGIRDGHEQAFRFIHIPVDQDASMEKYLNLHASLYDQRKVEMAIQKVLKESGKSMSTKERRARSKTLQELLTLFKQGGFPAVDQNMASRIEAEGLEQSQQLSHKLIRRLVYALYAKKKMNSSDLLFFEDAIPALSKMAETRLPFYIQLQDMTYKPAVILMVSYRPGELFVLGGSLLMLVGLLAAFYSRYRRIWMLFETEGKDCQVSMSGMGGRQQMAFSREFNELFTRLQQAMQGD